MLSSAPQVVHSTHEHSINMVDAGELAASRECDLLYIDPPYNTRQYSTNYHLLETLALGDEPEVRGVAGLRPLDGKRSPYCRAGEAQEALDSLVRRGKASAILMSYNSEGLIPQHS